MLEKSLGASTVSVFRARLAQRCQLCVLAKGDTLAGTLFFAFGRDRPFQHLALTHRDAVILDAWISPHLRGHGLYSVFLDLALSTLKGKGIERVFVATSEDNQPSLRALRRVGFRHLLRYRTRMGIYTYDVKPLCVSFPSTAGTGRSVFRTTHLVSGDAWGGLEAMVLDLMCSEVYQTSTDTMLIVLNEGRFASRARAHGLRVVLVPEAGRLSGRWLARSGG